MRDKILAKIQKAKAENLTELDLSAVYLKYDKKLTEIPPEVFL